MSTILRYRKKPVEVEAVQWTGSNLAAIQALTGPDRAWIFRDGRLAVITLAERILSPGDWVLREADGGISACSEKTFASIYEPAEVAAA